MLLNFGSIKIDTKGLPPIFSVNVYKPLSPGAPVFVHLTLDGHKRSAVERWAKRLGAQITVENVDPFSKCDTNTCRISAALESDGYQITVHTTFPPVTPAPEAPETLTHWPSRGLRTTTWCQGEPLTAESFPAPKSDVTCPACRELLGEQAPAAGPADTAGGAS